jgi:NAD(P)-dependent dehydrogenase (short-subunit alcohol dehydrogenase family)
VYKPTNRVCKVIATVRSLARFPAALNEAGARALELDLDASDEVVQQAAENAIRIYDHVDVLVNNAGSNLFGYGPVEEVRSVYSAGYWHVWA